MRPVADLNFHIGSKTYYFVPGDVNASDLPFLLPLFMALTQPRGAFDVENYLYEHQLWHCFTEAT